MEVLIVWLLFGVASSMIASSRGRDGCGWFLVGVLFGPFALIFALVSPKNHQVLEKRTLSDKKAKKCPYCAEIIKYEAVVCRFCGRDLEEKNTKSESVPEIIELEAQQSTKIIRDDASDEKIICRSCERKYDGAKRFCPFCGTSPNINPEKNTDKNIFNPILNTEVSYIKGLSISIILALVITYPVISNFTSQKSLETDTTSASTAYPSSAPSIQSLLSTKELPIPRSIQGDKGQYYLLGMQNSNDVIKALHKRVGTDSMGFTLTEINCAASQYRELGYSEISPEVIQENQSAPWTLLVPGSSKSDLAVFVCNLAKTQAGGEKQIIQTEDLSSATPDSPEQAKWDECSEKIYKPYSEKGLCGSGGCRDENDKDVLPKVLRKCGPNPATRAANR